MCRYNYSNWQLETKKVCHFRDATRSTTGTTMVVPLLPGLSRPVRQENNKKSDDKVLLACSLSWHTCSPHQYSFALFWSERVRPDYLSALSPGRCTRAWQFAFAQPAIRDGRRLRITKLSRARIHWWGFALSFIIWTKTCTWPAVALALVEIAIV